MTKSQSAPSSVSSRPNPDVTPARFDPPRNGAAAPKAMQKRITATKSMSVRYTAPAATYPIPSSARSPTAKVPRKVAEYEFSAPLSRNSVIASTDPSGQHHVAPGRAIGIPPLTAEGPDEEERADDAQAPRGCSCGHSADPHLQPRPARVVDAQCRENLLMSTMEKGIRMYSRPPDHALQPQASMFRSTPPAPSAAQWPHASNVAPLSARCRTTGC